MWYNNKDTDRLTTAGLELTSNDSESCPFLNKNKKQNKTKQNKTKLNKTKQKHGN